MQPTHMDYIHIESNRQHKVQHHMIWQMGMCLHHIGIHTLIETFEAVPLGMVHLIDILTM